MAGKVVRLCWAFYDPSANPSGASVLILILILILIHSGTGIKSKIKIKIKRRNAIDRIAGVIFG